MKDKFSPDKWSEDWNRIKEEKSATDFDLPKDLLDFFIAEGVSQSRRENVIENIKEIPHLPEYNPEERKGKVIVITSPSGGGKSTIVKKLLDYPDPSLNIMYGVSYTTRWPRAHEKNGKDYFFIKKEFFMKKVREGEFVEWDESANGHLYGTDREIIEEILKVKNYITELNTTGASSLKALYDKDCLTIFLVPPDLETLKERLEERGTESPELIKERMAKAIEEMDDMDLCDHVVINSNLNQAFEEVLGIIKEFLKI